MNQKELLELIKIGEGIKRIKDAMRECGLKVKFQSTGFFTVIFQRVNMDVMLAEKLKSDQKSDQKVLEIISENPQITIEELTRRLGFSPSGIKKLIRRLKAH